MKNRVLWEFTFWVRENDIRNYKSLILTNVTNYYFVLKKLVPLVHKHYNIIEYVFHYI